VCGLDHRYVVGAIADGEGDLFEPFPDYSHDLCFLDGQQAAADHSLAIFGQICQLYLILFIANNRRKVITLNQKRLRPLLIRQFLSPPPQFPQHPCNLLVILALISQYLKIILD
jgi:hypothetical protein